MGQSKVYIFKYKNRAYTGVTFVYAYSDDANATAFVSSVACLGVDFLFWLHPRAGIDSSWKNVKKCLKFLLQTCVGT